MVDKPKTEQTPRTYVLVGYDQEDNLKAYKNNKEVMVIQAQAGQTMQEIAAQIKTPANIILQAHGTKEGEFVWNKDEIISYSTLFDALPRSGIESIMLGSCYGGSAERDAILKSAPPGTLVQSMTGPNSVNSDGTSVQFAREIKSVNKPIDFFLKALDNFYPESYHQVVEYYKQQPGFKAMHLNSDPAMAMPHIVGLGGVPPQQIDLDNDLSKFSSKFMDKNAYDRAINRVNQHFDTVYIHGSQKEDSPKGLGVEGEKRLHEEIGQVAEKLKHENPKLSLNEKRIAYALTAAYLDESGILEDQMEIVKIHTGYALGSIGSNSMLPTSPEEINKINFPSVRSHETVLVHSTTVHRTVPSFVASTPSNIANNYTPSPYPRQPSAPTPFYTQDNASLGNLQNDAGVQKAIASLAMAGASSTQDVSYSTSENTIIAKASPSASIVR